MTQQDERTVSQTLAGHALADALAPAMPALGGDRIAESSASRFQEETGVSGFIS
jgi:hypothetical protein